MKILKDIKAEDLLWIYRFGIPKHKISTEDFLSDLSQLKSPVFFLSTGRCGTAWFNDLLKHDPSVRDFHSPYPNFSIQNRFMYKLWQEKTNDENKLETARQLFLCGREQHLRYAFKCDKRYFETNNHITFFAPMLRRIMPQSKFVHLYRHPGEFVRSGIRRGWYGKNTQANTKLIVPVNPSDEWNKYSEIGKIGWLWNETNSFIENFKKNLDPGRIFNFNFNMLNPDSVHPLIQFLEITISGRALKKLLATKKNVQKTGQFPSYREWDDKQKAELMQSCGKLAASYGYTL